MKAFVIDLSICNGCYCCQIACKDEHVANDWTPYAKPQPDTGQFWIGITEQVRGQVPKVKVSYIPKSLLQQQPHSNCNYFLGSGGLFFSAGWVVAVLLYYCSLIAGGPLNIKSKST